MNDHNEWEVEGIKYGVEGNEWQSELEGREDRSRDSGGEPNHRGDRDATNSAGGGSTELKRLGASGSHPRAMGTNQNRPKRARGSFPMGTNGFNALLSHFLTS